MDVSCAYACDLSPLAFAAGWASGHSLVAPLRGINIQRPWAGYILDGSKCVEARRYDVRGYCDEWLWLIETPGKDVGPRVPVHMRKHRITGIIRFSSEAVKYEGRAHWRSHEAYHRIPADSPFDWVPDAAAAPGKDDMYGWHVAYRYTLRHPVPGPAVKGVIGCKAVPRLIAGVAPAGRAAAAAPGPAPPYRPPPGPLYHAPPPAEAAGRYAPAAPPPSALWPRAPGDAPFRHWAPQPY